MSTATKSNKKSPPKNPPKTANKTRGRKSPIVQVVFSTFDSSFGSKPVYRTIRSEAISKWIKLTSKDYKPAGGTPLLDATAKFIDHLDSLKKTGTVVIGCLADESGSMSGNEHAVIDGINEFVNGMKDIDNIDPDSDGKVLAVIFTDGYENSSIEITGKQLSNMISNREKEGWTFIYLGANQDAWSTGRGYGFSGQATGSILNFAATPVGTSSALRSAGAMASCYLSSNSEYNNIAAERSGGKIEEDGTWKGK